MRAVLVALILRALILLVVGWCLSWLLTHRTPAQRSGRVIAHRPVRLR